jgi:hypothetical protein
MKQAAQLYRMRAEMARTPANLTQADVARVIRAARQAGAPGVEVRVGNTVLWVPFAAPASPQSTAGAVEPVEEVVL